MTYELIGTRLSVAENPVHLDHLPIVGLNVRFARLSVFHAGAGLADRGWVGVIAPRMGVKG
jgi:hypothetical protein